MTVGRAISPECSTDDRREWPKGAAALAISSRRPTGWLHQWATAARLSVAARQDDRLDAARRDRSVAATPIAHLPQFRRPQNPPMVFPWHHAVTPLPADPCADILRVTIDHRFCAQRIRIFESVPA